VGWHKLSKDKQPKTKRKETVSHYLDRLRGEVHGGILRQLFDPELQREKQAKAATNHEAQEKEKAEYLRSLEIPPPPPPSTSTSTLTPTSGCLRKYRPAKHTTTPSKVARARAQQKDTEGRKTK
jgi:hypothetical protein